MNNYTVYFKDNGNCDIADYEVGPVAGPVEAMEAAYEQLIDDGFLEEEVWSVTCHRGEEA